MPDGDFGNKNHVLTSWKEIANYLGKGVRTVQRWEKDFGLPIRRPVGSDKSAIIARASDLDAWVAMRCATRNLPDGAGVRSEDLLAVRSSLAAGLETARMLRELHSSLLAEVRTALDDLRSEILKMRSRNRRQPGPRTALPAPAVLLSEEGSQSIDAA